MSLATRENGRLLARIVIAVGLIITTVTSAYAARYQEQGGLIVVEIESAPPNGWSVQKTLAGFAGQSYFHWTGPDYMADSQAGTVGLLSFDLHISTAGTYELAIHNRHDYPDHTLENDAWTRMDDSPWIKTFSSKKDVWNWQTKFEKHGSYPTATYDLTAGDHTFQIAARSKGFKIDRFHLFTASVSNPTDKTYPQSPTGSQPVPTTAKILEPKSGEVLREGSVITLLGKGDGVLRWSYDANSDGLGELEIGVGTNVSFTIPAGVAAPQVLTLFLRDKNGQLQQKHSIEHAPVVNDAGVEDSAVPADSAPEPDMTPATDATPPDSYVPPPFEERPDSDNLQSAVSEGGCSLVDAAVAIDLPLLLLLATVLARARRRR